MLDSGNGFQRIDSSEWIPNSFFSGILIPMSSIPDSTSKNFMYSRIQITLHGSSFRKLPKTNFGLAKEKGLPRFA